ncbi:MAG: hypothetical protein A2Z99_20865 [Treponema sp. GWB1_62_6]|nr:MAG: hypothetical protein A2Z99_20865 [Treponema sp. GWB1_62_6]OHE69919.1 MAG: hypothetical protein A2001_10725 [Treponema sp. GWC1_61_84]OHE70548.1 MAG: hypothetical protein A2413_10605 [Treponema sp. RIFOXYC1_FULL_61_9]HCM28071.1 hypothetical protein [Treponema sp.]
MDTTFVTCPKCRSKNWNDIPNTKDLNTTSFKCNRCGYVIVLGACSKCKAEKAWELLVGIQEKGAQRPMYRFRCKNCRRVIGILLQPK